jgi:hypothetical protein
VGGFTMAVIWSKVSSRDANDPEEDTRHG